MRLEEFTDREYARIVELAGGNPRQVKAAVSALQLLRDEGVEWASRWRIGHHAQFEDLGRRAQEFPGLGLAELEVRDQTEAERELYFQVKGVRAKKRCNHYRLYPDFLGRVRPDAFPLIVSELRRIALSKTSAEMKTFVNFDVLAGSDIPFVASVAFSGPQTARCWGNMLQPMIFVFRDTGELRPSVILVRDEEAMSGAGCVAVVASEASMLASGDYVALSHDLDGGEFELSVSEELTRMLSVAVAGMRAIDESAASGCCGGKQSCAAPEVEEETFDATVPFAADEEDDDVEEAEDDDAASVDEGEEEDYGFDDDAEAEEEDSDGEDEEDETGEEEVEEDSDEEEAFLEEDEDSAESGDLDFSDMAREDLEVLADDLGVKFRSDISDKALVKKLEKALAEINEEADEEAEDAA